MEMKQRANKFKWLYVTFVFFKSFNSVGAEIQNSYVLGLGLTRAQIDKYWILILIQESELSRR